MVEKLCTKCQINRPLDAFTRDKSKSTGVSSQCRSCAADYRKKYYTENKDKIRLRARKRHQNRSEECRRSQWARIKSDPERLRRSREAKAAYYARRVSYDSLFAARAHIRRTLRDGFKLKGRKRKELGQDILGCSYDACWTHLLKTFESVYLRPFDATQDQVHIDHIVPVSWARTDEELLAVNHFSNLRLLLASDNMARRDNPDWDLTNLPCYQYKKEQAS